MRRSQTRSVITRSVLYHDIETRNKFFIRVFPRFQRVDVRARFAPRLRLATLFRASGARRTAQSFHVAGDDASVGRGLCVSAAPMEAEGKREKDLGPGSS